MAKKCICEICTCGNHACRHQNNLVDGLSEIQRLIENGYSYNSQPLVKARSEGELRQKRRQWETSPERLKEIYSAYAARNKENVTSESQSQTTSRRTSDSFFVAADDRLKVATNHRNPLQSITNADAIEELQSSKLASNSNKPGTPSSVTTAISDISKETNKTWIIPNNNFSEMGACLPENFQMNKSFEVGDKAAGFTSKSTVQTEFPGWNVPKPPVNRPKDSLKFEGGTGSAGDQMSTTRRDYGDGKLKQDLRPAINAKPRDSWKLDEGETPDYRTTIQDEYTPKKAEKVQPVKHPIAMKQLNNTMVVRPYVAESNIFSGQTTNQTAFKKWTNVEKPGAKDIRVATLKPEGGMNLESTNRAEYRVVSTVEKTPIIRPKTTLQHSGQFDDRTVSKETFRGLTVGEKQKSFKPVEKSHIVNEPLEKSTTIKTDYPNWNQKKPVIERPTDCLRVGGRMMELSSMTGKDFSNVRNVQPERKGAPENNIKQTGPTDFSTTSQVNYVQHEMVDHKTDASTYPKRNDSQWVMGNSSKSATMDGTTVSKMEYGYKEAERPAPVVQPETLKMDGPMDLNTVSQTEYMAKPIEKVEVARPPPTNIKMEGTMGSTTSSKEDYKYHPHITRDKFYPKRKVGYHQPNLTDIREEANTQSYVVPGIEMKNDIKYRDDVEKIFSQDVPVESESVTRREFKSWETKKEINAKPATHLKFEGDSDFMTTTKEVFTTKNMPKLSTLKPADHIPVVLDHGELADFPRHREPTKVDKESGRRSLPLIESSLSASEILKQTRRPQTSIKPTGEMDMTTTHQETFVKTAEELLANKEILVNNKVRPKPKTNIKFEGETDYVSTTKAEFGQKVADKAALFKPPTSIKFDIPIEEFEKPRKSGGKSKPLFTKARNEDVIGKSTLQSDFKAWDVPRNIAGKPPTHLKHEGRMELHSTMRSDFGGVAKGEKSKLIKPRSNLTFEGHHDLKTTNQHDYKPIPAFQDRRLPAGLVKKGEIDLQAVEIKKRDSRKLGDRPEPLGSERLPITAAPYGEPDDRRGKKSMYGQIWKQFEKYKPNRNKCSIENTGRREFTTTTGSAYSQKSVATVRPTSKTPESHPPSPNKIASQCSSKRNSVTSQGSLKQHHSHLKLTGGMDFNTTNSTSYAPSSNKYLLEVYKNQNAIKANAVKSSGILFDGEHPFSGKTTYNQHFTSSEPIRRPSCPAAKLDSKFSFKEMVNGHQYYMPVVQS